MVWAKARKNCELERRNLPSTQGSVWLCTLLFVLTQTPLQGQLIRLHLLDGVFLLLLDASGSGAVSSHSAPHTKPTCYTGLPMCELGGSKTYTILLPKTRLSRRVFYNKSRAECCFDPRNLSLWTRQVMTDDKRQVQPINAEWRRVRRGDANWVGVSGPCPIWVKSSTVHRAKRTVV